MNNSTQAQKGFQTFVLTLSVSLIIFSILYYFVTNVNTSDVSQNVSEETSVQEPVSFDEDDSRPSAFKQLAERTPMDIPEEEEGKENPEIAGITKQTDKAVLAGVASTAPEPAQSTVPSSGVFSVTVGLVSSFLLFMIAGWVIKKGPRNLALSSFEDQFLK